MRFTSAIAAFAAVYSAGANAQTDDCEVPVVPGQYTGTPIPHDGMHIDLHAQITYFKVLDPSGTHTCNSSSVKADLSLVNYMSLGTDGKKPKNNKLERAVIVIAGLYRDAWNYQNQMTYALNNATLQNPDINRDTVAIMSPFFMNGDDKGIGYPWNPDGEYSWDRSYSAALVWKGSEWSAGAINNYPSRTRSVSSYDVLDQIVQYWGNKDMFPNMKQIVVAGHSLGAQMVQHYAAVGKTRQELGVDVPITYYIGNPNSYTWMQTARPLSTSKCSGLANYDTYRDGWTDYANYGTPAPMTYNLDLVNQGRAALQARYNSKKIAYGRATRDKNDKSSHCAPYTQGKERNERFFNYLRAMPPSCPSFENCDTVDFVDTIHKAGIMFASSSGLARIFTDNWGGSGRMAYDIGYPRQSAVDDPYPDPAQAGQALMHSDKGTYPGGKTYRGCFSDVDNAQTTPTLANRVYTGQANTRTYCSNLCTQQGYSIAGVRADQCWCDNQLSAEAISVVGTSCESPCPGNRNAMCGGISRLSIFASGTMNHA